MRPTAVITVHKPREEVERLWRDAALRAPRIADAGAEVTFRDAPGDHGTEIHVMTVPPQGPAGQLGAVAQKLTGAAPAAKFKDDLRRFKALVETGVIARSDATPEGESVERKLKQRPAQPLSDAELREVGLR